MDTTRGHRQCSHWPRRSVLSKLPLLLLLMALIPTSSWAKSRKQAVTLFWTHDAVELSHATYVTPAQESSVHAAKDRKLEATQAISGTAMAVNRKGEGSIPLRAVDGKVRAARCSAEKLAAYWARAASKGHSGIAIDEFGDADRRVNEKMVKALMLTRKAHPHLFIAVWNAGRLSEDLARAYAQYANLVVLETYFKGDTELSRRFERDIHVARRAGILHKTLFALGINDENPFVADTHQPWANSRMQLEAQMKWIRSHAPIMPGIAIFAPNASLAIQRAALQLASKIFGETR